MLANVYHIEDNDRSCRRSGENGTTVGTVLKRAERIGTSVTFLAVVVRAPPVSWGSQSEGPVHRGRAGTAERAQGSWSHCLCGQEAENSES